MQLGDNVDRIMGAKGGKGHGDKHKGKGKSEPPIVCNFTLNDLSHEINTISKGIHEGWLETKYKDDKEYMRQMLICIGESIMENMQEKINQSLQMHVPKDIEQGLFSQYQTLDKRIADLEARINYKELNTEMMVEQVDTAKDRIEKIENELDVMELQTLQCKNDIGHLNKHKSVDNHDNSIIVRLKKIRFI